MWDHLLKTKREENDPDILSCISMYQQHADFIRSVVCSELFALLPAVSVVEMMAALGTSDDPNAIALAMLPGLLTAQADIRWQVAKWVARAIAGDAVLCIGKDFHKFILKLSCLTAAPAVQQPPVQIVQIVSPCIHISGTTGTNAQHVNGIYDQTDEISCGQPVYIKRDDATKCIHFWDKTGHWIVGAKTANKSLEDKGLAYLPHRGSLDTALSLNTWSVIANKSSSWVVQPDVRCVCGVGNFEGGLKKIDGDVWLEYHAGKFAVCDAEDRRGGKGYIFCDADPESFPDMLADEVIDFRLFRTPWLAQRPWYSKVQVPKHSLQDYRSYYSKRCARCNM